MASHPDGYEREGGKYVHRIVARKTFSDDVTLCGAHLNLDGDVEVDFGDTDWCGKRLSWEAPRGARNAVIVDHLDHDRSHNDPSNLVISCSSCNSRRQRRATHIELSGRPVARVGDDWEGPFDS